MPVSELAFGSALVAARAIRRGDVSSVELTTHLLGRIQQLNPKLNAIVTLTAEAALERARSADEALARGVWWGPSTGFRLTRDGLPVGIQIVGPYLEDATPIDLASRLADVTGEFRTPKGFQASAHGPRRPRARQ